MLYRLVLLLIEGGRLWWADSLVRWGRTERHVRGLIFYSEGRRSAMTGIVETWMAVMCVDMNGTSPSSSVLEAVGVHVCLSINRMSGAPSSA